MAVHPKPRNRTAADHALIADLEQQLAAALTARKADCETALRFKETEAKLIHERDGLKDRIGTLEANLERADKSRTILIEDLHTANDRVAAVERAMIILALDKSDLTRRIAIRIRADEVNATCAGASA